MIGAIIGDIAGSIYEWDNIKYKPEKLINPRCHFTDDTVLTAAVTDGILQFLQQIGPGWRQDPSARSVCSNNIRKALVSYAGKYPDAGYGGSFVRWIYSSDHAPYNSWGNGSAMRVSCCGWAANSPEEAKTLGEWSAAVTHDHPEGIKGAQAVAECICRLRDGADPSEIREVAAGYYDMNFTLDEIRPDYEFDVSCQGSVPQAIEAFLEGESFEDVIRLAISIGGDSDTIAAIAGSLAEIAYPVPNFLKQYALSVLPDDLKTPVLTAEKKFGRTTPPHPSYDLTRFLTAQEESWPAALSEIRAGRKRSHWMWYIFPQIKGLGHSFTSRYYAIKDIGEARAYLADPVLGGRLREISRELLKLHTDNPKQVFGYPDDMKLKSSMTLFEQAGKGTEDAVLFGKVLDKYFQGKRDEHTLRRI